MSGRIWGHEIQIQGETVFSYIFTGHADVSFHYDADSILQGSKYLSFKGYLSGHDTCIYIIYYSILFLDDGRIF